MARTSLIRERNVPVLVRKGDWILCMNKGLRRKYYALHKHRKDYDDSGRYSSGMRYKGFNWIYCLSGPCNLCQESPPIEMQGFLNLLRWRLHEEDRYTRSEREAD